MKYSLLIIGLVFVITATSYSQGLSIGPQIGYQRAQDADEGKLMGGAALRLKLSPALGGEASVNYREEGYDDNGVFVRSWPVQVTGLLYPVPVLYGAIGAGWYNSTLDYDQNKPRYSGVEDETTQKFGWHFGGGIEVPPFSNTKLTADVRYVFLDYDFDQVPGSGDLTSDFYMITAGLQFGF